MKTIYLIMSVAIIGVQTFHSYYAIDYFNHLPKKWMRETQNIMFCIILSSSIMVFTIDGKLWGAFFLAGVELCINLFYYQCEKVDKRTSKAKATEGVSPWLKWWVFIWLYPLLIALFSHQYANA